MIVAVDGREVGAEKYILSMYAHEVKDGDTAAGSRMRLLLESEEVRIRKSAGHAEPRMNETLWMARVMSVSMTQMVRTLDVQLAR